MHVGRRKSCAPSKGAPTISREEECVSDTEQRKNGMNAAKRDALITFLEEDYVSDMVQ